MNKKEQLLAQLAELESETAPAEESILAPAKSHKNPQSLWDTELPADWKPESRYVEERHVRDNNSKNFKIGEIYDRGLGQAHLLRQAIPKPSYADVGAKLGDQFTNDLELEYARLDGEWYSAARDLESCIYWIAQKLKGYGFNRHIDDWSESDEKRRFEQTWAFLQGLWTGRGITPIGEKQLETWAQELLERYQKEQARLAGLGK
jgi:hypothetical protein